LSHDAFISYSHVDKIIADAVCHRMEAAGIRCWIAPRDIAHGKTWDNAVVDAITTAKLLIVIFSSAANASRTVLDEVAAALDAGSTVIPFRIEDIRPTGSLRLHLGRVHWLDALTLPLDAHIDQLIESAKRNLPVTRQVKEERQDAEQQQLAKEERRRQEEKQHQRQEEEQRHRQEEESPPQTQKESDRKREVKERLQPRRPFLRRPAVAITVIAAVLLMLVVAWMLAPGPPMGPQQSERTMNPIFEDMEIKGSDIIKAGIALKGPNDTPERCQQLCLENSKCEAWTFVRPRVPENRDADFPYCWLKNSAPFPTVNKCCVSGHVK
jgi:TIR domain/PAN domain